MIDDTVSAAREKMKKALDVSRNDIASIRSGRATPALVENIVVMAYGGSQKMRIQEMATITTMDAKTIVISPYDVSTLADIEKGIQTGSTGLTPVVDRDLIRITIPPLSEERRMEYIKLAKAKLEAGKVMVRQVRGDAMRDLKKADEAKTISEDERKHGERLIQELTDEMIAEIDTMATRKEQELLQV
jgi:ribosome recycling factor